MKWDDFREKAGNRAGKVWLASDIALLGKSFVENKFDITKIASLDTLAGLLLITSANILNKRGDTHKGTYQAMGLSFLAYLAVMGSQIMSDKHESLDGLMVGAAACVWSAFAALYGERKSKKSKLRKTAEKKEKPYLLQLFENTKAKVTDACPKMVELFQETKEVIVNKYPNLIPMAANTVSNVLVIAGSIADKDWYLASLGFTWTIGSVLMAISKQKTEQKSTPAPS